MYGSGGNNNDGDDDNDNDDSVSDGGVWRCKYDVSFGDAGKYAWKFMFDWKYGQSATKL